MTDVPVQPPSLDAALGHLARIEAAFRAVEGELQDGRRRLDETDGRIESEVALLRADLAHEIQTLRNDVAATVVAIRAEVTAQLGAAGDLDELRGRIAALEARQVRPA